MKIARVAHAVIAGGLLLIILGAAGVAQSPTFLRSIRTANYRTAAARADGTALAVKKDGVILRDPAGGTRYVVRLRNNQRVSASSDARRFGVATYADNAPSTLHVIKFEMYDTQGKKRWTLQKPKAAEFKVGPRGLWTVGVAGAEGMHESELYLYNALGEEVATWQVPYLSDLTLPQAADRFFAASRQELMAFPHDGGRPRSFGRFESFATSADGHWVVTCGGGSLSVFDGNTLKYTGKTDVGTARAVAISADGRFVALGGGGQLELHDSETRSLLWTVSSGSPEHRFISVALSGDPMQVICGLDRDKGPSAPSGKRHTEGALLLFNQEGRLVWRENLAYDRWNFKVPQVNYMNGGKQFEVVLADERRHYSLP